MFYSSSFLKQKNSTVGRLHITGFCVNAAKVRASFFPLCSVFLMKCILHVYSSIISSIGLWWGLCTWLAIISRSWGAFVKGNLGKEGLNSAYICIQRLYFCRKRKYPFVNNQNAALFTYVCPFWLSASTDDLLPPGFPNIDMGPQLKVVERTRTATMLCAASGNPDPEITWYKDFLPIDPSASNGRIKQLRSGKRSYKTS